MKQIVSDVLARPLRRSLCVSDVWGELDLSTRY
jgi:hypothetical protein